MPYSYGNVKRKLARSEQRIVTNKPLHTFVFSVLERLTLLAGFIVNWYWQGEWTNNCLLLDNKKTPLIIIHIVIFACYLYKYWKYLVTKIRHSWLCMKYTYCILIPNYVMPVRGAPEMATIDSSWQETQKSLSKWYPKSVIVLNVRTEIRMP